MVRQAAVVLVMAGALVLGLEGGTPTAQPGFPDRSPLTPFDPESVPLRGDDLRWPAVRGVGICHTEYGWCPLAYPERFPPGTRCYCLTEARQRIMGITAARTYYGQVNPYFNPWR
jgi:hypothetical protein